MLKDCIAISFAMILILLFENCVCAPSSPELTTTGPPGQELAKLKAKVMSADYRADIDALSRLRDDLARLGNDRDLGYLAHYWSGFASWRIAINGANHDMKVEELKTHLQKAATEFYSSIRLKNDFADAYAAASSVNGWLAVFYMGSNPDMATVRERISLSNALLARARDLDPENPRVLWVQGGVLLFAPPPAGGDIPGAIAVYRRMLASAKRRGVNAASPLPDWGEPEALMSIAYAHTRQMPPDLRSALDAATAALKVEPDWSYVRDNLMPQIEKQLRAEQR